MIIGDPQSEPGKRRGRKRFAPERMVKASLRGGAEKSCGCE
jgi:hypothetical protein